MVGHSKHHHKAIHRKVHLQLMAIHHSILSHHKANNISHHNRIRNAFTHLHLPSRLVNNQATVAHILRTMVHLQSNPPMAVQHPSISSQAACKHRHHSSSNRRTSSMPSDESLLQQLRHKQRVA